MDTSSLAVRVGKDYYKLDYQLFSNTSQLTNLVIPSANFSIQVKIFINNNQLATDSYGSAFIDYLSSKFRNFWGMLGYDTAIAISDESESTFTLKLTCKVFTSCATSNMMEGLELCLHVITNTSLLSIQDLSNHFNYLLASWYLHMEHTYPLVFSFVGRHFAKTTIFWYRKTRQEVLGHDTFDVERILPVLVDQIQSQLIVVQLLKQKGKLQMASHPITSKHDSFIKSFAVTFID
ncbi:hypothetical protein SBY92_003646 [Candida maltosa Xu316]|uniref:Uncharacterized protein n=1 Tax=Candida maltosa (strain Xu316) TaxID=1245528 RepID=M3JDE7_CANMX|nr:hypothetical protein G210_4776 [Candida maltosa Xu316]